MGLVRQDLERGIRVGSEAVGMWGRGQEVVGDLKEKSSWGGTLGEVLLQQDFFTAKAANWLSLDSTWPKDVL